MQTYRIRLPSFIILPLFIVALLATSLPTSAWYWPERPAGITRRGEKVKKKKRRGPATRGIVKGVKATTKGTKTAAKATAKAATTVADATAEGSETAAKVTAKGATTAGKSTVKGTKTVGKTVKKFF